jgi:para-aminobenzoate synthetase/4-amino-4-deoxychorismate lyase
MPALERPIAEMLSGVCVLLEDRLSPGANARLYHTPKEIICCTAADGVDRAIAALERGLRAGLHAAGLLSYELGYALEPKLRDALRAESDTPLLWFGLFEAPLAIAAAVLDETFADVGPPAPLDDVRYGHDLATHMRKVDEVLKLIQAGDIYQANLTFPISFLYRDDPVRLYAALRCRQPVSFGGFASLGDRTILSVSPELFFDVKGNVATTRPMKGTSPRGGDVRTDDELRIALREDPKQRAENLMIVDLLRNDLSRVAELGSVKVPSLFEVETYPGFHAMSSTITAVLRGGTSLRDRFAALFPCGSIVGAPKIRAAEILRDLEDAPRGFYTGALGCIAPDGDMRFNVAIRTAVIRADGTGLYGVGGGIVAESRPDDEYAEALLKARVLTGLAAPFDLIETFRWQADGGFVRLGLHLDRLGCSAATLGFSLDRLSIERELGMLAERACHAAETALRVRLVLSRSGTARITTSALSTARPGPLRVGLAEARLDPGDPFLRHKTSLRNIYETAFADACEAGLDEAIFLNTRGDVAEASRNTIFIESGGTLLTPLVSSGILPGVLRHTLLQSGEAREQVMSLTDVANAPRWFLGNSLHGLREATLVLARP